MKKGTDFLASPEHGPSVPRIRPCIGEPSAEIGIPNNQRHDGRGKLGSVNSSAQEAPSKSSSGGVGESMHGYSAEKEGTDRKGQGPTSV